MPRPSFTQRRRTVTPEEVNNTLAVAARGLGDIGFPGQIRDILAAHTHWIHDEPEGKRADLSGLDLSGLDLSRAVMAGAKLSGADLSGATLHGADLRGANLSRAALLGANLSRAKLAGVIW